MHWPWQKLLPTHLFRGMKEVARIQTILSEQPFIMAESKLDSLDQKKGGAKVTPEGGDKYKAGVAEDDDEESGSEDSEFSDSDEEEGESDTGLTQNQNRLLYMVCRQCLFRALSLKCDSLLRKTRFPSTHTRHRTQTSVKSGSDSRCVEICSRRKIKRNKLTTSLVVRLSSSYFTRPSSRKFSTMTMHPSPALWNIAGNISTSPRKASLMWTSFGKKSSSTV